MLDVLTRPNHSTPPPPNSPPISSPTCLYRLVYFSDKKEYFTLEHSKITLNRSVIQTVTPGTKTILRNSTKCMYHILWFDDTPHSNPLRPTTALRPLQHCSFLQLLVTFKESSLSPAIVFVVLPPGWTRGRWWLTPAPGYFHFRVIQVI